MAARYLAFIGANLRFLGFGFLLAFFSTFGQTFYIAMYGDAVRATFALSHGEFGSLYALGTLSSGLLIMAVGHFIDRVDLRIYACVLAVTMALACLALSLAQSVVMLGLAIFLLRIAGQGLLSQAATVTMARYFDAGTRGRAVSIAALGFPFGQALFPSVAVALLAWLSWREAWAWSALLVMALMPALILWLLRGHGSRHAALAARTAGAERRARDTGERQWRRAEVLRDPRFVLAMLAMLGPSFTITGLNFHQVHLVSSKGWDLGVYASGFAVYAVCQVGTSMLAGVLIDRIGTLRLTPFYMLPMAASTFVIAGFDAQVSVLGFMALAGATGGASQAILSTTWAELYGVVHLGAIKAMVAGLMVIASALAPPVFGVLIDAGVRMESIAMICGVYLLAGCALLWRVFRVRSRA